MKNEERKERKFWKDALLVSLGLTIVIVLYEVTRVCLGGF